MPPPEVEVIRVERGAAELTRELPGRLQAVKSAQVRARVEAIVEKRLFREGSEVRAGQTLFKLDDRTYRAAALAAQAEVAVRRAQLERLEVLLPEKAVSQQDADLAGAQLEQAQAQLVRVQMDLDNTAVPAPIDGRIGRALVTEGALVGRGEATHLATIESIDPIQVLFSQPNADLLRLRSAIASGALKRSGATRVELVLDDGSLYPHPGRLLFSELSVDPNTGAVAMKAEFPNPRRELLPGSFVRVRLPVAAAEGVVRLPQRALLNGPQGQFVLLVDGEGKVSPRPVTTQAMAGADFVIGAGLEGGETVIVGGVQKARPGMVVKPVSAKPPGAASGAPPSARGK
ncbi:MAG TPA: efflux transporter periplasmic adaptor subunit [Rhodocyclaceae bacterium]|nr:efflux transporter periplasmic adaptor subunit [Rhodocyclaceae bacterium]